MELLLLGLSRLEQPGNAFAPPAIHVQPPAVAQTPVVQPAASSFCDEPPRPLEEMDPELAEHFRLIAQGIHPAVIHLSIEENQTTIGCRDGSLVISTVHGTLRLDKEGRQTAKAAERNSPCRCGSGKKYKKCCLLKK